MAYKLIITEHAEKLIDKLVSHLLHHFKNQQAAVHLLDGIDIIYNHLKENPFKFPISKNIYLADKGYREALVPQMKYIIIFVFRIILFT